MYSAYPEITEALGEPLWWNEDCVPRYVPFSPSESANIYVNVVVLAAIACQSCGYVFRRAVSSREQDALAECIRDKTFHLGDPPNYCCGTGSTMNSVPLKILEFWGKTEESGREKVRIPELEKEVLPDWWIEEIEDPNSYALDFREILKKLDTPSRSGSTAV